MRSNASPKGLTASIWFEPVTFQLLIHHWTTTPSLFFFLSFFSISFFDCFDWFDFHIWFESQLPSETGSPIYIFHWWRRLTVCGKKRTLSSHLVYMDVFPGHVTLLAPTLSSSLSSAPCRFRFGTFPPGNLLMLWWEAACQTLDSLQGVGNNYTVEEQYFMQREFFLAK